MLTAYAKQFVQIMKQCLEKQLATRSHRSACSNWYIYVYVCMEVCFDSLKNIKTFPLCYTRSNQLHTINVTLILLKMFGILFQFSLAFSFSFFSIILHEYKVSGMDLISIYLFAPQPTKMQSWFLIVCQQENDK